MMLRRNADKCLHWTTQEPREVKLYMQSCKCNRFMSGWNPQSVRSMPDCGFVSAPWQSWPDDVHGWPPDVNAEVFLLQQSLCDTVANVSLEIKSHVCPFYQHQMGRLSRSALAHLSVIFFPHTFFHFCSEQIVIQAQTGWEISTSRSAVTSLMTVI